MKQIGFKSGTFEKRIPKGPRPTFPLYFVSLDTL